MGKNENRTVKKVAEERTRYGREHIVAENSTDDEKTVEKLAEKRKRPWARRESHGDETGGRENGCTWVHIVTETSTDDERTVGELAGKRKRLWAKTRIER